LPEIVDDVVDLAGTCLHSNVTGRAEAKRPDDRTRIKLWTNNLIEIEGHTNSA